MNEVLNNPMVIDVLNKVGVTLDTGLAEYVRYTVASGAVMAILGGISLLLAIAITYWLGWMGYKTRDKWSEPPYSLFGVISFLLIVIPSACCMVSGILSYLCPIGSMINGVIK